MELTSEFPCRTFKTTRLSDGLPIHHLGGGFHKGVGRFVKCEAHKGNCSNVWPETNQFLAVFVCFLPLIPIKYLHLYTQFGTAKLQHHQFRRLKWEKNLKRRQVHGLSNVISAGRAPLALTGRHVVVAQNLRCQKKGPWIWSCLVFQSSNSLSLSRGHGVWNHF